MITYERIREVMDYDHETGIAIWRVTLSPKAVAGAVMGCADRRGRIKVQIDGRQYYLSRLIWLYQTGEMPDEQVEHRDVNSANNKWINLRLSNQSSNNANRRPIGATGLKGVCKNKNGKYSSFIMQNRKYKNLGTFECPAAASFAYQIEADKVWGEFARWK